MKTSLKTKKTLVFELMKPNQKENYQIKSKKSLKKSFEKVLKSKSKNQNKKYTKI